VNGLVRDLVRLKDSAEILGSKLSAKNFVSAETLFYWYKNCEQEFVPYFSQEDLFIIYSNSCGLISSTGAAVYQPNWWRLTGYSFKRSLNHMFTVGINKFLFHFILSLNRLWVCNEF
jgi:hypothetical protein